MKTFQEFLAETRDSEYSANIALARRERPVETKPGQKEKDQAAKTQLNKIDLTPTKKVTV